MLAASLNERRKGGKEEWRVYKGRRREREKKRRRRGEQKRRNESRRRALSLVRREYREGEKRGGRKE
jgi:hypothetical protein